MLQAYAQLTSHLATVRVKKRKQEGTQYGKREELTPADGWYDVNLSTVHIIFASEMSTHRTKEVFAKTFGFLPKTKSSH